VPSLAALAVKTALGAFLVAIAFRHIERWVDPSR
jgi:hypothetical protein